MGHKKPNKLIGLSARVFVIILLILLILLILYIFGILNNQSLINFNEVLGIFKDIFFSLTLVLLAGFVFVAIFRLSLWVGREEGIVIQPFKVGGWDDKNIQYNGHSVADLLIKELLRIRRIYYEDETIKSKLKSGENIIMPDFSPSGESLDYNIANLGTVGQGQTGISIGQLLIVLKRLSGKSGAIITGSLQKYGSIISIVAWMGQKEPRSWEVKSKNQSLYNDQDYPIDMPEDEEILTIVRKLAFKIAIDLGITGARTYEGLINYIEALDDYHCYIITDNEEKLESSVNYCVQSSKSEKYFIELSDLFYALGFEYFIKGEKEDLEKAKELFKKANKIKPENSKILLALGSTLDKLERDKEAIKVLDEAESSAKKELKQLDKQKKGLYDKFNFVSIINNIKQEKTSYKIDRNKLYRKFLLIYNNRASVLRDLGNKEKNQLNKDDASRFYKLALNSLSEAMKFSSKLNDCLLSSIYYNYGTIYLEQGKYDAAIDSFNESIRHLNKRHDLRLDADAKTLLISDSWKAMAEASFYSEKFEDAKNYYRKSIMVNPKNVDALYGMAQVNLKSFKYIDAISCIDKAIDLKSDNKGE